MSEVPGSGTSPLHFIQELAADSFDALVHHPGERFVLADSIKRGLPVPYLFERPGLRQFPDDGLGHIRVLAAVDLLLQPPVEVARQPHTHLLA